MQVWDGGFKWQWNSGITLVNKVRENQLVGTIRVCHRSVQLGVPCHGCSPVHYTQCRKKVYILSIPKKEQRAERETGEEVRKFAEIR